MSATAERFTGEYDQMAFDPAYDTLTMEEFAPTVHQVLGREPWGEHTRSDFPLET